MADKKKKTPQKKKMTEEEKRACEVATNHKEGTKYVSPYKDMDKKVKAMVKDIDKIKPISDDQLESLLTAIGLGMVKDAFGLDASLDVRIKALGEVQKIRERKTKNQEDDYDNEPVQIIDDIAGGDDQ